MKYEVQQHTLCEGWVNNWRICEDDGEITETFDTKQEAQTALDEFLQEIKEEIECGERDEDNGYDETEFRIVGVAVKSHTQPKAMNSLADFKRQLKSHKGLWRFTWSYEDDCRTGLRKVVHLQSNAVAMWREGGACLEEAIANPHKSATWLHFPKAKDCRFEGEKIIIQAKGDPMMMSYEKLPQKEQLPKKQL